MSVSIKGELEIDVERGVVYFHPHEGKLAGGSLLRIEGLPTPIRIDGLIDINARTPGIIACNYAVRSDMAPGSANCYVMPK